MLPDGQQLAVLTEAEHRELASTVIYELIDGVLAGQPPPPGYVPAASIAARLNNKMTAAVEAGDELEQQQVRAREAAYYKGTAEVGMMTAASVLQFLATITEEPARSQLFDNISAAVISEYVTRAC
jgi:hypothetical protein